MNLKKSDVAKFEKIFTLYENGTSIQNIATEMGLPRTIGNKQLISNILTLCRKLDIDLPNRNDGINIRLTKDEVSQYEKWLEFQRMRKSA